MYNSFGSRIASFGSVRSFLALGFFIIFISCRAMALAGEAPLSAEAEWERTVKAAEQKATPEAIPERARAKLVDSGRVDG